jgi:hypothetical protein
MNLIVGKDLKNEKVSKAVFGGLDGHVHGYAGHSWGK